jgi:hypothetical protein
MWLRQRYTSTGALAIPAGELAFNRGVSQRLCRERPVVDAGGSRFRPAEP